MDELMACHGRADGFLHSRILLERASYELAMDELMYFFESESPQSSFGIHTQREKLNNLQHPRKE
jgi:hypothetical protein